MTRRSAPATWILLLAVAAFLALPARADVGLKIFTEKGYVGFVVGEDWTVLSMDTKGPVTDALFQLPNSADAGTDESTNLALVLYDLSTEQGRAGFGKPVIQHGQLAPEKSAFGHWTVYRQRGLQHGVEYTILEARRKDVADRAAMVSFAWPHLPNNPPDYGEQMEQVFHRFLQSVEGHVGPYRPQDGEVIRRPTN